MTLGGSRAGSLDRLAGADVDVLVIGAGILGVSTAWAASQAGARVAIVDQGDIAGATSSASSKLLHGGLRYLAMGDVKLVREAHRERRLNARRLAPHLVRPLEFVVPVGRDAPVPLWKVRAGVWLYGSLARFGDGRSGRIPVAEAGARIPGLRTEGIAGTVLYQDHLTHDGRLTLAAAQAAAAQGAIVAPYVEVAALRITGGRVAGADLVDRLSGAALAVTARSVVNATGPWVDAVRRMESSQAGTSVRLSKGAHLLLEAEGDGRSALTTPLPNGRVSFAIPWEGMLLLGTTDEPFDGDPAVVTATDDDQRQILARSLALRRSAGASGGQPVDRPHPARDDHLARAGRDGVGGGRQAHHLARHRQACGGDGAGRDRGVGPGFRRGAASGCGRARGDRCGAGARLARP